MPRVEESHTCLQPNLGVGAHFSDAILGLVQERCHHAGIAADQRLLGDTDGRTAGRAVRAIPVDAIAAGAVAESTTGKLTYAHATAAEGATRSGALREGRNRTQFTAHVAFFCRYIIPVVLCAFSRRGDDDDARSYPGHATTWVRWWSSFHEPSMPQQRARRTTPSYRLSRPDPPGGFHFTSARSDWQLPRRRLRPDFAIRTPELKGGRAPWPVRMSGWSDDCQRG